MNPWLPMGYSPFSPGPLRRPMWRPPATPTASAWWSCRLDLLGAGVSFGEGWVDGVHGVHDPWSPWRIGRLWSWRIGISQYGKSDPKVIQSIYRSIFNMVIHYGLKSQWSSVITVIWSAISLERGYWKRSVHRIGWWTYEGWQDWFILLVDGVMSWGIILIIPYAWRSANQFP